MMDVQKVIQLQQNSKKRNFVQTYELIVNLRKDYDLKKPENRIVDYIELPHGRGKKVRICAIVGPELEKTAKQIFDEVLVRPELKELASNKRKAKEIAKRNYIFVAQASTMVDVGKFFGRYLGPRDKLPNPKYGMIFPDKVDEKILKGIYDKMQKLVRVSIKKHLTFGIPVGTESMEPEKVAENVDTVLNWLVNRIPGGKVMIKSVYFKLTMSKPIRIW